MAHTLITENGVPTAGISAVSVVSGGVGPYTYDIFIDIDNTTLSPPSLPPEANFTAQYPSTDGSGTIALGANSEPDYARFRVTDSDAGKTYVVYMYDDHPNIGTPADNSQVSFDKGATWIPLAFETTPNIATGPGVEY